MSRPALMLLALGALAPLGFAAIPAGGYFARVMAGTAFAAVVGLAVPRSAAALLVRSLPWTWALATSVWMAQQ